jgi:hypothetical protein
VGGSVLEPREGFAEPKRSSDRKFGLVMAGACLLFGMFPLLRGGHIRVWLAILGVLFLAASLLYPAVLDPLNRGWAKLGLLLSKVTNPLLMALLFFGGVWPMAALMRLFGVRPLGLDFDRRAETYWIARPPREASIAMRKQF